MTTKPLLKLIDGALLIDNSTRSVDEQCPRAAEYAVLHRRGLSQNKPALIFGGAIHEGLKDRYMGKDLYTQQNTAIAHMHSNPFDWEYDYRTPDFASTVLGEYNTHCAIEDFEPLHNDKGPLVECPFAHKFCDMALPKPIQILNQTAEGENIEQVSSIAIYLTGRIDVIAKYKGHTTIVDHKTTSQGGSTFDTEMSMSAQQDGYCWAYLQSFGKLPDAYCINALVCRKPTKTGKNREFFRLMFPTSEWRINEWYEDTYATIQQFLHHYATGLFPRRRQWCVGKYGTCPYYPVCSVNPKMRDSILYGALYSDLTWTPLD